MDPYRALGVEPSWTLEEIEARYRRLMLQHHPDLHRSEGEEAVAAAERRSRSLNEAIGRLRREHREHGYAAAGDAAGASVGDSSVEGKGTGRTWFSEPDTSSWATGPEGEDFGITYGWPPPPEDSTPTREQPCPFCGEVFSELTLFEQHLSDQHGWDYRNARPRKTKGRRKRRLQRGPRFSKAEHYIETLAIAACVAIIGLSLWYRSTTSGIFARAVIDPFLFLMVAFCSVIAFRLIFWRRK